ncbi:MAG: extracellular solute-binding protein [Candidatus Paceibacterota bacterium]|jgi:maltose-binding protein MalE
MKVSLFQGILFGVFGLAAIIGLFVFATYTSNSGGGSAVGTVVIWGTLPKEGMQSMLTAVAKTETGLKNVSYVQKDPATLPNDLATAIATGSGPDLVLASQEELHTIAKFITPIPSTTLSAATFTSTFVGEGQLFAAADGYYGIPFLVDPLVLFSNHTILSSDGIAKPPTTWEALTGLVPNVAIMTPARQITRGLIALGSYDNVHNSRGILSTLFLQTGTQLSSYSSGGVLSANLGERSATGSGVSAGEAVLGFYTQFADPSKISYTWNASLRDSQQAFLAGDLALYLGYASEAHFLVSANPNLDFGVSPVPQPAIATTKSAYGLVYAFMIPIGTQNSSGAYQAAALLTNPVAQEEAASLTGLAPAVLSELATAPADPVAAVAYAEALYTSGWLSPMPADTDAVFSGMITDVITGRSGLATALVSAGRSLSALLQQ